MACPGRELPLLLLLLCCAVPLTLAAVTIPPLLEDQPTKGEVLYTVTHDPDQPAEPFTLPCRAEGLPAPSYSWLKDGESYDLEDEEEEMGRVEMVEGEGSLVFHDPRPEDQGSYQCVAENPVGVAYSEVTWVRRAVMGNFRKSDPRVVTATLGQSISLTCTPPEGYPDPSLHWVLQTSDGGLRSLDSPRLTVDEEGTLWFSYVVPEDASEDALYACAASSATSDRQMFLVEDEEGQLTMVQEPPPAAGPVASISLPTEYRMGNWVYLNVSYPGEEVSTQPDTPVLPVLQHVSHQEIIALQGDDLRLFCIFGGYPVPEIRWWRESRADVESDQLDHYGKVLLLQDLTEADMGSYYCQATNEAGQSDPQQFTVYVEAAPEWVVEPEVVNLPAGETAVFSCEASGDPEPSITWLRDGHPLDTHDTTVVFDTLDFSMKAVIACNASNHHGYVYKSVYLNVLSLPPEWLREPEDVEVLAGEAATLLCEAYGSPDPNITWATTDQHQQSLIHDDDPRYSIDDTKLIIKSVDATTEGHYRCIATNRFASLESEAYVAMRGKTEAEASLSSDRIEAGDHVSLDCLIKFDPHLSPTVTWFKDDVKIDLEDDNYHLGRREFTERANSADDENNDDEDDDGQEEETWVLEMLTVAGQDSGVYTCRVHTHLDDATDDLILTVQDVPGAPILLEVRCGERQALLQWLPPADNNAPLQGYVIQYVTPFHPDEWKDAENKILASKTSFSVDMSPGLNYTFRVLAFNRVGMSQPSEETWQCAPPGLPPDHHPYNVTILGTHPGTMLVSWQAMEPEEHNGPDFHYSVLWRPVGELEEDSTAAEEADDRKEENEEASTAAEDAEEESTAAEEAEKDTTAAEETEKDSTAAEEAEEDSIAAEEADHWHTRVIQDWEKSEVEVVQLVPYQRYEVQVAAHNAYGAAADSHITYSGRSGQDVPEEEPTNVVQAGVGATTAVLTWTPVDDRSVHGPLLGYQVEYWEAKDDDDVDDEGHEEVLTTGPEGRVELTDLTPYTTYHARVSAVNSAFTGPASSTLTFTTAEGESGPVPVLEVKQVGGSHLMLEWQPPQEPHGVLQGYIVEYCTLNEDGEEGPCTVYGDKLDPSNTIVKLADLEEGAHYWVTVAAVNGAGKGEGSSVDVELRLVEPRAPDLPNFTLLVMRKDEHKLPHQEHDADVHEDDARVVIIGDNDKDGDVDEADVRDTDNDGDVDADDIKVADINKDGTVDEKDVQAADRDGDGDVDVSDIGDEDGDGDFDGADVIAADEDGDGDVDGADEDEEDVLLEDRDQDGDVDHHDVTDINHDGVVDEEDFHAADVDNDGDVDDDDVKVADKDGDGDIDAADVVDVDGNGRIDGNDLQVRDRDADGDVDARDYRLRHVFLTDVDGDGDVDSDDILDMDNDGDVDEDDREMADIDNDGDVDGDDITAADRDGDGDVDAADIGDEDDDGDIDGYDVVKADKNGDGVIDAADDDEENTLLEDSDLNGIIDGDDVVDLDGDGDVDVMDFAAADIDNDGDVDEDDVRIADKDGDGDVDAADVLDINGDGRIDGDDLEVKDRDADGDIDAKDFTFRKTFLADTDGDGDVDEEDVLDVDGDGDIDGRDISAADIDDDGDVDQDDVKQGDKDGDNDVDSSDVQDVTGDGTIDEADLQLQDKDADGDVDARDFLLRKMILGDTDADGDVDVHDVLDTDGDGDVDDEDISVADIDNDGDVDADDVIAGDRNGDGIITEADIGDEDGDGDVDGADVIAADKDGDGDIDAADDDGENILLSDIDGDGDVDQNDVGDLDGDGDVDDSDLMAADVDNDGDVDGDDITAADRDGDGDIDGADIVDVDGDGDVDGKDLVASDKDGDGDVDWSDLENLDVFLKDTNHDGRIDASDVLDSDHDGDVDDDDIAVADIDNDGDVDIDDVTAGDRDLDGDVDFKDIGDQDGDGDVDGSDVEAADQDGDGDIDAADDGRGVDVRVNWRPNFEEHPGVDFYVQTRVQGTDAWKSWPVEERHLYQTVRGLDPRRTYEVRIVARDGPYETPSQAVLVPASEEMEEPTVGAVMEDTNPILWTWFIIAVMVAVTMVCIIFFSMWVYSQRIARVAELRRELYKGYEPAQSEPVKQEVDVEAAKPEEPVEDEMTANYQRKQLAAMMKRQETIQSVDSFASHDDDFAEYGDESMGRFNDDGSLIYQKM